jgi:hypothetical protein
VGQDAGFATFDGGFIPDEVLDDPTGFWTFDDCNPDRSELTDQSFNVFTAFRSVRTACTEARTGQGLSLPNAQDLAYVPD